MKKDLTKLQYKTLEFIAKWYNKTQKYPLVRDIQKKFKITSGSASDRVKTLIQKGWLTKKDHKINKII